MEQKGQLKGLGKDRRDSRWALIMYLSISRL